MSKAIYLRALEKAQATKRNESLGTVCTSCGTAFMANPALPNTETCGLCKVRKIEFQHMMECISQKVTA